MKKVNLAFLGPLLWCIKTQNRTSNLNFKNAERDSIKEIIKLGMLQITLLHFQYCPPINGHFQSNLRNVATFWALILSDSVILAHTIIKSDISDGGFIRAGR